MEIDFDRIEKTLLRNFNSNSLYTDGKYSNAASQSIVALVAIRQERRETEKYERNYGHITRTLNKKKKNSV